ncbi:MAG: L-fucose isomerase, partial [Luteolibacter sp.]
AGSIIDPVFFEKWLGMRVESVDMVEFVRRIERGIFDPTEYTKAIQWVRRKCREGADWNARGMRRTRKQLDREWETSVKMTLIARDLMRGNPKLARMGYGEESLGHNAIAAGFQGQRQWTDHMPNGDFMEAILNSSFDWNGSRAPYILATENDSLNAVGMLFGYLLTQRAQVFADLRTYWSPDAIERATGAPVPSAASNGLLHLINSGPAALDGSGAQSSGGKPVIKPFWEISRSDINACLRATSWHPSISEYFPGGGWSTRYASRGGMPVTMFRLNITAGLGPVIQLAEGETVELPETTHRILEERTNPTWPTTWFVPRLTGSGAFRDSYSVMNHWGANHCVMSYGHIGADLITLASMLRIPVSMHNVDSISVFRPSAWSAFGSSDIEAADYRACVNFGPIYR